MLDESPESSDSVEELPVTVLYQDNDKEWAAVLAAAPAMARLPDMVAQQYGPEAAPDPKDHEELQQNVRDRVRTGIIFIFKLIENNINKLFEQFDVRFGSAIDLLMDDIEATYARDEESVENYTGEEVCGRFFAYIAMEVYCKHRCDTEPDDGSEIDDQTGFYKNMESMPVLMILENVLDCVRMTPQFKADVRREATVAVHTHIFLLLDADSKTVWH